MRKLAKDQEGEGEREREREREKCVKRAVRRNPCYILVEGESVQLLELIKARLYSGRLCIRIIQSHQRTARAIHAEYTAACKITLPLSYCPYA